MASSSQYRGIPGVYLSFYGPDLGPTFLSHLRSSLSEDEDGIRTCLFQDIKVAIVIFSKNYASFSWCLNELREIMEYRKSNPFKLMVLPVFYSVDPTDVRTPRKSFERALVIHENKFGKDSAKVKSWREALSEAGSLSGFCFKNHGSEAELIESVVGRIHYFFTSLPRPRPKRGEYSLSNCHPLNKVPSLHLDDEDDRRSYDVFLSFRGPDTRHTIISHLYRVLCQKGVHTFKDNPELDAGQRRCQLFKALKKSRIAIVMFSKNYARSKWCLEELTSIIKLKEDNKLIVIPIFYRMSPEEVRLHGKNNGEKGCYQIAMEEMEAKYGNEMVESWKEAL